MVSRLARTLAVVSIAVAFTACSSKDDDSSYLRQPATDGWVSAPVFASVAANTVHLTGDEEIPNAVDTKAVGQFLLKLNEDGTLDFKLIASNIQNVTQAHIHRAAKGSNGGVVVWLYPAAPPAKLIPGRSSGILSEGTISASSLVGSLAGQPLSALIAEIEAGRAYVNVHTQQFPGGEIRGQFE